ncbi:MAG: hypothetical protein HXY49_05095 [Ignavibacteriaceae bacterium]|jgi:hypothetical protein|nr:hypothetical protein [Ignavibacteriaceae bacterium]
MSKHLFFLLTVFSFLSFTYSQQKIEDDLQSALINAKKGVYWALANLQGKKTKFEKSLISDDKLISKVKVSKELNGVKIESTGYYQTIELTVVLYRSSDSLIKDGYIKKGELDDFSDEN